MPLFNSMEEASIGEYIKHYAATVEEQLARSLPGDWQIPHLLRDSMHYSLMAGGKRLRPVLVIAAVEAAGGSSDAAMPVACAVEMIHTYSLIHDDLPAMDDDDFRRGKPTNHKVYGEAMAILAGDALLTQAFFSIAQAARHHPASAAIALAIIEELAVSAGAKGMVGGQAADIMGEQGQAGIEELDYIHTHKTGDLIAFSLKAGGRLAGASEAQLQALETYGYKIGLAFQIQDDILDLTGDEVKLGKPLRSDEKQEKVTYPFLFGLEHSRSQVRELTETGKQAIRKAGLPNPRRLLELADYLVARDY